MGKHNMKLERAIDAVEFLCRIVIEDASGGVSKETVKEIRQWLGASIGQPGEPLSVSQSSFVSALSGQGGTCNDRARESDGTATCCDCLLPAAEGKRLN